jgi:hypothetical protein
MSDDPRFDDPIGRIAYLKYSILIDVDKLAHVFEQFAQANLADAATHGLYRRIATCLRDFHSSLLLILSTMPQSLAEAADQSHSEWPYRLIRTTKMRTSMLEVGNFIQPPPSIKELTK